ncbi:hypothetical protein M5689_003427 [Euphorbia peplus]|nr:hypothetical protein M5689_003427 [Euphorbia peplus]
MVWKAIVAGVEVLGQGVGRILRSGKEVSFWLDKWVDDVRLVDVVNTLVPTHELKRTVSYYWSSTNNWKWSDLGLYLPTAYLFRLASLVILQGLDQRDGWSWVKSSSCQFSVKYAFNIVTGKKKRLLKWRIAGVVFEKLLLPNGFAVFFGRSYMIGLCIRLIGFVVILGLLKFVHLVCTGRLTCSS